MGWWPFGSKADGVSAKRLDTSQDSKQQPSVQDLQLKQGDGDVLAAALAKPTSIFEFGDTVPVGSDILKGMCAGSDPDAIHACTWTIEQAQGKGREKKPKYRVEF
eukprot:GHRQ01008075.1.p2 GENE.GHRQ01008075.1~~GHRQ01008075.1.p2  ORF type:complete len:105 (+),score=33.19 GHRQ01008075.1:261-575(+)